MPGWGKGTVAESLRGLGERVPVGLAAVWRRGGQWRGLTQMGAGSLGEGSLRAVGAHSKGAGCVLVTDGGCVARELGCTGVYWLRL